MTNLEWAHYTLFSTPWINLNFQQLKPCIYFKVKLDPRLNEEEIKTITKDNALLMFETHLFYYNTEKKTLFLIEDTAAESLKNLLAQLSDEPQYILSYQIIETLNTILESSSPHDLPSFYQLSLKQQKEVLKIMFFEPFDSVKDLCMFHLDALRLLLELIVCFPVLIILTTLSPLWAGLIICLSSFKQTNIGVLFTLDLSIMLLDNVLKILCLPIIELTAIFSKNTLTFISLFKTNSTQAPSEANEQVDINTI